MVNITSNEASFESLISDLTPGTTYYVRAYATNSAGTGYGNALQFNSLDVETLRDCLQAYPSIKGEIVTTILNGVTITCSKINDLYIFQGDIIIASQNKGAAIDWLDHRWPDNIVYYTINSNFPNTGRITDAFKEFEGKTNISFRLRTNEPNYVEFNYFPKAGCYSDIGMIGGKQSIVIDNWSTAGSVAHEIGHAIGLLIEQSKSTRDQYIIIKKENIQSGMAHNFEKYPNSVNTLGFDFNSLMLYDSYDFSLEYGVKPTITKLDGTTFVSQTDHFTETDINMINELYPPVSCKTFLVGGYEAVQIGTQVWMAKNLNIITSNSWVYPGTGSDYGRLYTWEAAMSACPVGWHIPSDAEWDILINYLGGSTVAGGKMKEVGTVHWSSPNLGATNSNCFTALPGGRYKYYDGLFYDVRGYGVWWSSTVYNVTSVWVRDLDYYNATVYRDGFNRLDGLSVRCIRN